MSIKSLFKFTKHAFKALHLSHVFVDTRHVKLKTDAFVFLFIKTKVIIARNFRTYK